MARPEPEHDPLTVALALAALGLRVIPIAPGRKHPALKGWQLAATNDPDTIRAWWTGPYRGHGVGLAMGPQPNGTYLVAIDCDVADDGNGMQELLDLVDAHHDDPQNLDTWISVTGAGGRHVILDVPAGRTVRNQQGAGRKLGDHIDVRGHGGQIVVAPTVHPVTGARYEWARSPWDSPLATCADWLVDLICEPVGQPAPPAPTPTPTPLDRPSFERPDHSVADRLRDGWDWPAELTRAGWVQVRAAGTDTYWCRPGKDPRHGHSAVLHGHDGPLVVFTDDASAAGLHRAGVRTADGTGVSVSPLAWVAGTQHGGDLSAAARALGGAPTPPPPPSVDPATGELRGDPEPTADDYDAELLGMLIDWQTFADTDHNEEEWLWEPILAARRATAIFAKGGTGKSLVTLRLVVDIIRAGIKVLYLDYEMTADDLADRLHDMGIDDPVAEFAGILHYAQLPSLPPLDAVEGGRAILRLAELVGADLVVIDTFARAVSGDENDADTVRQFYRMTGLHLKAAGRAFLRIDHAGKDPAKGQRGSSAKNDDVDVVWELRRTEDGYEFVSKKKRMGWVPERVNLERSDDPFELRIAGGVSYPAGTGKVAGDMDDLGLPLNVTTRAAGKALRDANKRAANDLVRAAVKYRKRRSPDSFLIDDPRHGDPL